MQVRFYKTFWGMSGPIETRVAAVLDAGYTGFEAVLPDVLEARRLGIDSPIVAQAFPNSVDEVKAILDEVGPAAVDRVALQAGKDWWDEEIANAFFEGALAAVADSGLTVGFETHRGKLLYHPQSTLATIRRFPELRLTADFSHWTCVCESMLHDQEEALNAACERVVHLHARVGHEEGPQVPDPQAERWQPALQRFEEIWDRIYQAHLARGDERMTIDPEFGPPNYLWTDPETDRPLADLFVVSGYVRNRPRARWGAE